MFFAREKSNSLSGLIIQMHQTIAAIGDSHSHRCFEKHHAIADSTTHSGVNKLDGKTAFRLVDHDRRVQKVIAPLRGKHLVLSAGEADVRIHIQYQHCRTGIPTDTLLENTARRYVSYVAHLRRQGFDIHIFNVVPTGNFEGAEAKRWQKNLAYPFTTGYRERKRYTLALNGLYKKYCTEMNVPFIDIYRYLIDETGKRKNELVYDFSHLNGKVADILLSHYSFS